MAEITGLITFLFVTDLETSHQFYSGLLGLNLAVDQGDCRIYRITDSGFLGICARPGRVHDDGLIVTLITDSVDETHQRLVAAGAVVESAPKHSAQYQIHHAFYRDPDGHLIEVQSFDDPDWAAVR